MAWRALRRVGPVLAPRCPRFSPPPSPLRVPAARRLATSSLVLSGEWRPGGGGGRKAQFCREPSLPLCQGSRRGGLRRPPGSVRKARPARWPACRRGGWRGRRVPQLSPPPPGGAGCGAGPGRVVAGRWRRGGRGGERGKAWQDG